VGMVAYAIATQLSWEAQRGYGPRQGSVCVERFRVWICSGRKTKWGPDAEDLQERSCERETSDWFRSCFVNSPWRSSRKPSSHRLDMRTVTSKVTQLSLARLGGQRPASVIFARHISHNSPCQLVPRPSLSRLSAKQRFVAARPASKSSERQVTICAPVKQAAERNAFCDA